MNIRLNRATNFQTRKYIKVTCVAVAQWSHKLNKKYQQQVLVLITSNPQSKKGMNELGKPLFYGRITWKNSDELLTKLDGWHFPCARFLVVRIFVIRIRIMTNKWNNNGMKTKPKIEADSKRREKKIFVSLVLKVQSWKIFRGKIGGKIQIFMSRHHHFCIAL